MNPSEAQQLIHVVRFRDRDLDDEDRELLKTWSDRFLALKHIYRYVGLRGERFGWFYDLALRSLVHFPAFSRLNDPFEGAVRFTYEGTEQQVREYWTAWAAEQGLSPSDSKTVGGIEDLVARRSNPAQHEQMHAEQMKEMAGWGVLCLAESPVDLPMWSYYADSHRGLCLRFRTDQLWNPPIVDCGAPIPVVYTDYPKIAFYLDTRFRRGNALQATKAQVWDHEDEWRIVHHGADETVPFPPAALDGVILGCRIAPEDEVRVLDVLARRTPQVERLRAREAKGEFKLEISSA